MDIMRIPKEWVLLGWTVALIVGIGPAGVEAIDGCDMTEFFENCETGCPYGYVYDNYGCPVCECAHVPPDTPTECEPLQCDTVCEDYVLDETGCATCECGGAPPDNPDGETQTGCDLTDFYENCSIGCPYGYQYVDSCPTCECAHIPRNQLDGCRAPRCDVRCEDYMPNEDGCLTCTCANTGSESVIVESVLFDSMMEGFGLEMGCDLVYFNENCQIGCPYGYQYDPAGCPTCTCADVPEGMLNGCELPTCPVRCEDYRMDEDECLTCECG